MLEKYQHAIFDLDGTLVGTDVAYRYIVVPQTLHKLGVKNFTTDAIDKFWLEGDRNATIRVDFHCDPQAFWEIFATEDKPEERIKYTHPYNDAGEVLYDIKQSGKDLAIITDAPARVVELEVGLLPKELFSWVVSISGLGYKEKPEPESFFHCLKRFQIDPKSAVYIGNSNTDGIYAANVGVDFIHLDRHFKKSSANYKKIFLLSELIGRKPK